MSENDIGSEHDSGHLALALTARSEVLRAEMQALRADWEPELPPPITELGLLGRASVDAAAELSDDELYCLADVVENIMCHGSDADQTAVATGFLEAVLNASDENPSGLRLVSKLGPLSRAYCKAWDEFCGVHTPGLWDDAKR